MDGVEGEGMGRRKRLDLRKKDSDRNHMMFSKFLRAPVMRQLAVIRWGKKDGRRREGGMITYLKHDYY